MKLQEELQLCWFLISNNLLACCGCKTAVCISRFKHGLLSSATLKPEKQEQDCHQGTGIFRDSWSSGLYIPGIQEKEIESPFISYSQCNYEEIKLSGNIDDL